MLEGVFTKQILQKNYCLLHPDASQKNCYSSLATFLNLLKLQNHIVYMLVNTLQKEKIKFSRIRFFHFFWEKSHLKNIGILISNIARPLHGRAGRDKKFAPASAFSKNLKRPTFFFVCSSRKGNGGRIRVGQEHAHSFPLKAYEW